MKNFTLKVTRSLGVRTTEQASEFTWEYDEFDKALKHYTVQVGHEADFRDIISGVSTIELIDNFDKVIDYRTTISNEQRIRLTDES